MKIFVAKLAFKTTAEDLRALFEQFGTVESCKVIMDHETGRSKCYGFVEMPNDDEAYKAIVETDETGVKYDILYDILIKQNGDLHSDWDGTPLDVEAYRNVVFEPYDLRWLVKVA